jgi:nitrate/nitrite transporter NarK
MRDRIASVAVVVIVFALSFIVWAIEAPLTVRMP